MCTEGFPNFFLLLFIFHCVSASTFPTLPARGQSAHIAHKDPPWPTCAGTPIPSFDMGHPIPWWFHPFSSPWKGQKGTFNPKPHAELQRGTSPQQWGCCVHGHIKVYRTDELTSKQQGRTLNTSHCLLHTEAFSHTEDFPHFFLC